MKDWVDKTDVFAFSGIALVGYGTYQIYPPAAYIVTGLFLFGLAMWSLR